MLLTALWDAQIESQRHTKHEQVNPGPSTHPQIIFEFQKASWLLVKWGLTFQWELEGEESNMSIRGASDEHVKKKRQ
jgi:hypothetical protein